MTARMAALLLRVTVEFFWGEAAWGMTEALRNLRWLRLIVVILPFVSIGIVLWVMVDGHAAPRERDNGDYSQYEGKALEEKVIDLRGDVKDNQQSIQKLLELAQKQQAQIDHMQAIVLDAKDAVLKILTALVIVGGGGLLYEVLRLKFRKRTTHRRGEDDYDG